jgi:hypothetical protein
VIGNTFVFLKSSTIIKLVLETAIWFDRRSGMCLSNKNANKMNLVVPI